MYSFTIFLHFFGTENFCGKTDLELTPTSDTVNITSYNYPNDYDFLMLQYGCKWRITAPAGRRIVVSIKDIVLGWYPGYETIVIDDHIVIDLQKWIIVNSDYISDGNTVVIQFYSYYWISKHFWLTAAIYDEPGKKAFNLL